jgi:hypothetical protein
VQLAALAIVRGRIEEARALLDDGLELSLTAHSTSLVTLCLAAFAHVAFAENNPEHAALLVGAAEGLRSRVSMRAWPMLRGGEAEQVAQIRASLGTDRFDQMFAAGARLSQQQAVAAARDQRTR